MRQHRYQHNPRKRIPPRSRRGSTTTSGIAPILSMIILVSVLVGLGLVYVDQVNGTATGGLTIRELEQRMAELTLETQELEFRTASLQSLTTVEEVSAQLELVEPATFVHLPPVSSAVALAE